jgi:hypothetical protein
MPWYWVALITVAAVHFANTLIVALMEICHRDERDALPFLCAIAWLPALALSYPFRAMRRYSESKGYYQKRGITRLAYMFGRRAKRGGGCAVKTITVGEFMEFGPCYSEERVRELAGDKERWSALEILALKGVPAKDRLWAVLREELIDAPMLHEFACRCAERALARAGDPDPRSVAAIEAKRRWLRGEAAGEELAAARQGAWAAARAAAEDAARDAAWDAVWAAARDAAAGAARNAARSAALAKEREAQASMLASMLNGEEGEAL